MRLDGPTLSNLEVLATPEGGQEGSLFARLDSTVYPGVQALPGMLGLSTEQCLLGYVALLLLLAAFKPS